MTLSKGYAFWKYKGDDHQLRWSSPIKIYIEKSYPLKGKAFQKSDPFEIKKGDDRQLRRSSPEIIHWKVRAFERPFKSQTLLNEKRRRPSTKMVVARNFFRMNIENIREKKLEKKRATPAFRRASLRPFFFGLFQTSDERTNRRSKAYSQRIAAENCSNDHNTPIFN